MLLISQLIGGGIDPDFTDFVATKFKPKDSFRPCVGS